MSQTTGQRQTMTLGFLKWPETGRSLRSLRASLMAPLSELELRIFASEETLNLSRRNKKDFTSKLLTLLLRMMNDTYFPYDASITVPLSRVPVWPYTLDYRFISFSLFCLVFHYFFLIGFLIHVMETVPNNHGLYGKYPSMNWTEERTQNLTRSWLDVLWFRHVLTYRWEGNNLWKKNDILTKAKGQSDENFNTELNTKYNLFQDTDQFKTLLNNNFERHYTTNRAPLSLSFTPFWLYSNKVC